VPWCQLYRWNSDTSKQPKAWYIDVADANRDSEEQYLKIEIYHRELTLKSARLTAYNRFSDRIQQ
jgi:DNA polymerase-3 subunit epsilon